MRYCKVLMGVGLGILTGCMTIPSQPPATTATKPKVAPAPVPPEPPPPAVAPRRVENEIKSLLAGAEAALADDRLTSPIDDNAFDRYQAVLMLRPDHPQAISGLQQILLRYIALAREAAAHNAYHRARILLDRARWVDKDNALIADMERQVAQAEAAQKARQPGSVENEYPLAPAGLAKRDSSVVNQLQDIAREVQQSGDTLLIVARNDAEGRWIYQQMRDAVPGFRLRGDIKLGKQPVIKVLPPID